jgi:hypothetical protein
VGPLDESQFEMLSRRHRRELHVHCYRWLPSTRPRTPFRRARGQASIERAEREGNWRLLPTMANRMPTAASYLRRPGDTEFRAFKLDVLRIESGAIAEITTFGASHFPPFKLQPTL